MPTVAASRSSQAADSTAEIGIAATPRKTRLRSDSNAFIGSLMRKSPRLCTQGSPNSSPVTEKCLKPSMNLLNRLPQEKVPSENFVKKLTWDPSDVEQLRAVKEAIHVSTAPRTIVCREYEQNMILNFCKNSIKQEKAGSLYVCGCPGTGKSLSMEKVKESLVNWANEVLIFAPTEFGCA